METKKATISRQKEQDKATLVLTGVSKNHEIILTDDNPNNIKLVFNSLIKDLKKGAFQFELEDSTTDLFHNICKEYLIQLNSELLSIYNEMDEFDLLEIPDSADLQSVPQKK
jgi:hypothetical protein